LLEIAMYLVPFGATTTLTIPGSFLTKYYDILAKPDGSGFIVVTCSSPSPFARWTHQTGGTDDDNWSFYFHEYNFNVATGQAPSRVASHKFQFTLDSQSAREAWGVYGFREPSIQWAGKNEDGDLVIAMAFVIDYGLHENDNYSPGSAISESRIALALVDTAPSGDGEEWPYYSTTSVDPVDGDVLTHIVRIVSPISKPSTYLAGSNHRFDGFLRHCSPKVFTNCIWKDNDIVESARQIGVAYIVNNVPFSWDQDYARPHLWDSGKTRTLATYGSVYYCLRKFVPNFTHASDKDELLAPIGEQFRTTVINAGMLDLSQDNWGNVVFAYTSLPVESKLNQFNYDKMYPQYRIMKVSRIRKNLPDKEFVKPAMIDEF